MYKIYTHYNEMINYLITRRNCNEQNLYDLINGIFSAYGNMIKCYIVEEYIESEWLDVYSVYYCKQRYNIPHTTLRIHILNQEIETIKEITSDNYYGYLTLRPICNNDLSISRIRLRYYPSYYESKKLFVIEYKTKVSFPHIKIEYISFPFFRQDGMVTVCANADMHMLIKLMHKVHGFNQYGITNILNQLNSSLGRDIPNEGLSIFEMVYALKSRGFNPMLTQFKNAKYQLDGKEHLYTIFDFLDTMIESNLPVILAYAQHVVVIAGVTYNKNDKIDRYLVFDDSGYHISSLVDFEKRDKFPNFSRLIKKDTLEQVLISKDKNKEISSFVIVPTYKSLFYRYKYVSYFVNDIYSKMIDEDDEIDFRIILVDSKILKIHLVDIGIDDYNDVLFPRYVWFVEFYNTLGVLRIMVIDAMAHQHKLLPPVIKNSYGNFYVDVKGVKKLTLLKELS